MPKSALEVSIDKATNENNVTEDWGIIFEIVDLITQTNSEKEAIRLFIRKLNDKDPHVVKHTLTLLNACVTNCDKNFKLEVCSRTFIEELKSFVIKKRFPTLSNELSLMIEKWQSEKDFKNDPAFSLIQTLYTDLKKAGIEFSPQVEPLKKNMKIDINLEKKEDEDLKRAIELSLKESSGSNNNFNKLNTPNNSVSSLFGSLAPITQKVTNTFSNKAEKRKIKALYDFEAVEDNEITFKAGDILLLTDDSDQNWWKGIDSNGIEGLFPSNFVTFNLNEKIENLDNFNTGSKKVSFNDKINVNLIEANNNKINQVYIDEKKIDKCIELLQNADPTGEIQPDTQDLLDLEDECYMMGPLIDQKLQLIDEKHSQLEDLNAKLFDAFQIYNDLMKESITKATNLYNSTSLMSNIISTNASSPMLNTSLSNPQINYLSAPPLINQNSILLANKLNSLTLNGSNSALTASINNANTIGMNSVQQLSNQSQIQPSNIDMTNSIGGTIQNLQALQTQSQVQTQFQQPLNSLQMGSVQNFSNQSQFQTNASLTSNLGLTQTTPNDSQYVQSNQSSQTIYSNGVNNVPFQTYSLSNNSYPNQL